MSNQTQQVRKNPAGLMRFLLPFQKFLERNDVVEICVNNPQQVFVEGEKGWEEHEAEELSVQFLEGLSTAVGSYTKQEITRQKPILSGTLPNGERIQIVMPPAIPEESISITIRKPSQKTWTLDELCEMGLLDDVTATDEGIPSEDKELLTLYKYKKWEPFLKMAVREKKNIVVSGPTGSGKTTISKSLIPHIPMDERILTIEDTVELEIPHRNRVRMIYSKGSQGISDVSARELLESSLRMRPDRILLQELRDATAFYYLRNVNTGHSGSITTIHANSAKLAFEQLALLVKESEAGRDLSRSEIKEMLTKMVDIVIQVKRFGNKRKVTEIYYDPEGKQAL